MVHELVLLFNGPLLYSESHLICSGETESFLPFDLCVFVVSVF